MESSEPHASKDIVITRSFAAPLEKVWSAWTDASLLRQWWGPKDYSCTHASIRFTVGGKYLASMKSKDQEMWSTGEYREIEKDRKIVMTDHFSDKHGNILSPEQAGMPGNWGKELLITLEFDENLGKTDLTLRHEGIPPEMQKDCIQGWQESFDKLHALVMR